MDDLFNKFGEIFDPNSDWNKWLKGIENQFLKIEKLQEENKINDILVDCDIEPMDEDNTCWHCGNPCSGAYCSTACKNYDLE